MYIYMEIQYIGYFFINRSMDQRSDRKRDKQTDKCICMNIEITDIYLNETNPFKSFSISFTFVGCASLGKVGRSSSF